MVNEAGTTATQPATRRPPRRAGERRRRVTNHEDRWTDIVERAGAIFYRKGSTRRRASRTVADESVGRRTAIFELMKTSHLWHRPSGPLSMAELGDWYATFAIRGLGGPRWRDRKPG